MQATSLNDTNAVRLIMDLKDGSRVVGTGDANPWKFHSDTLGDIQLAPASIASIECQRTNSASVKTVSGDTLAVALAMDSFNVKSSFGDLHLPASSIRHVQVSKVAAGAKSGLLGRWSADTGGIDPVSGTRAELLGGARLFSDRRGPAFSLEGGRSYLHVTTGPGLDAGTGDGLTITGWIKPANIDIQMPVIEFEQSLGSHDGSDVGLLLYINLPPQGGGGPGSIAANVSDTTSTGHVFASGPYLLQPYVWQHVALTYDKLSGEAVIYLNGMVVATEKLGTFTPQTSFQHLLIGARTAYGTPDRPSDKFTGSLDEVSIYDHALSATEVESLYSAGKASALSASAEAPSGAAPPNRP